MAETWRLLRSKSFRARVVGPDVEEESPTATGGYGPGDHRRAGEAGHAGEARPRVTSVTRWLDARVRQASSSSGGWRRASGSACLRLRGRVWPDESRRADLAGATPAPHRARPYGLAGRPTGARCTGSTGPATISSSVTPSAAASAAASPILTRRCPCSDPATRPTGTPARSASVC